MTCEIVGTLSTEDLAEAVILRPDSTERNLVQPTANGNKGLILKQFSSTQSKPLLDVQLANGVSRTVVGPDAYLTLGDQEFEFGPGFSIPLKVAASLDNDDAVNVHLLDRSTAGFAVIDDAGNDLMRVSNPHSRDVVTLISDLGTQKTPLYLTAAAGGSLPVMQVTLGVHNTLFTLERSGALNGWLETDTGSRNVSSILPVLLEATDDHWRGGLSLIALDFNGAKEGLRIETDGTAARVGFLGAPTAARQSLPLPATDADTTMALANKLRELAIAFGLGE